MGVVSCACDHWSSLPTFITVVCTQKLMLTCHNLTQEYIQVRRECFHCVCFHVGCWARKSPPYKQIIDICCTKPTKAFLLCCEGKGHSLNWSLFSFMGTKFTSRAAFLQVLPGTVGDTFSKSLPCCWEVGTPSPAAEKFDQVCETEIRWA